MQRQVGRIVASRSKTKTKTKNEMGQQSVQNESESKRKKKFKRAGRKRVEKRANDHVVVAT